MAKSIWHSVDETPKKSANVVVLTKTGHLIDNREKIEVSYPCWLKFVHAKKWCYLKDLINA
jgi:hypothetical protein